MTSHLHEGTGWIEGPIADCSECRPDITTGPGILREGYKTSTQVIKKDSRGSTETKHWSGRQDANIRPAPATMQRKGRGIQE